MPLTHYFISYQGYDASTRLIATGFRLLEFNSSEAKTMQSIGVFKDTLAQAKKDNPEVATITLVAFNQV